jgi:MoaA/NifB/PqqE/SkfB family radical SAM enzyme
MCNVWKFSTENSHKKVSELSTNEVKDFLEEVTRLGARFLCLSGGEPALRSDLVEIIQKAKKEGLEVTLITNGTLVKHDLAEKLVKSGLDTIIFSIDSSNPNPHDIIRGVKGSWEKAVQGIKSVNCMKSERKLEKPKICINYAVTRLNYGLIEETIDLRSQLGFDEIFFLPVIPKTTRAKDLLLTHVDLEKLWSLIPSIKARMKKSKLQTNSLATLAYICRNRETAVQGKYAVPVRSQIMCLQPWQMATIDPFGNVYPCCYACVFQNLPDGHIHNLLTEDQFNMGNIKE